MRPPRAPRSVADMPAQVRRACECLASGMGTRAISDKMGIGKVSVQALLDRARKMTDTGDRDKLVRWCKEHGGCRRVGPAAPYSTGAVRTLDGGLVEVFVYSALQMLEEEYPLEFIAAAGRLSERRRAADRGTAEGGQ